MFLPKLKKGMGKKRTPIFRKCEKSTNKKHCNFQILRFSHWYIKEKNHETIAKCPLATRNIDKQKGKKTLEITFFVDAVNFLTPNQLFTIQYSKVLINVDRGLERIWSTSHSLNFVNIFDSQHKSKAIVMLNIFRSVWKKRRKQFDVTNYLLIMPCSSGFSTGASNVLIAMDQWGTNW